MNKRELLRQAKEEGRFTEIPTADSTVMTGIEEEVETGKQEKVGGKIPVLDRSERRKNLRIALLKRRDQLRKVLNEKETELKQLQQNKE
jgi:hypothetical protein